MPRLSAVCTIAARERAVARTYRMSYLLGFGFGFLNLVVYFFIGETLTPRASSELDGAPGYFAFAAAGITVATVAQWAGVETGRRLREEQVTGAFESIALQPVRPSELALGIVATPYALAAMRSLVYLAAAALVLGLPLGEADLVALPASVALFAAALRRAVRYGTLRQT